MYYNIFPTTDNWISSGSDNLTGEVFVDANYGKDQILELKKVFFNDTFDYQTRVLVNFAGTDLTSISASVSDGTITNPKYYLKLYEAEGTQELTEDYTIAAFPISESWVEGVGKANSDPKVTNGCSWKNRSAEPNASEIAWTTPGGGVTYVSGAAYVTSQSFSNESPDVSMDVSRIVNGWFDNTNDNYGFLLRFSGSQETNTSTFGQLKFFSRNTHTIYAPKLQVRWDDHSPCTGSNTGSLTQLTMSGGVENYIYPIGFKESYKETEKVKFRFGARKRYIQKTFSTSVQTISGSFIPEGSGSYSIIDKATGETVVPFDDDYTKLSCDVTSNYFTQWLNGFEPDRAYKILIKVKYDDKQEHIFDDDFEFIIRR
tara:strand:- start:20995 stop:22110 length:1116 start_codon:yes stop_codon:yes gene_type:complete